MVLNVYGDNLNRVQQLKAKYDPRLVFDKMHAVMPDPLWMYYYGH